MIFKDTFFAYRISKLDQHARKNKHSSNACFIFSYMLGGREPRSGEIPETGKFQAGAKKFC